MVAILAGAVYNHQWRAATMKSRNLPSLGLAIIFFCLLSARGAALTSEEAENISQQTGRPLLAVLGRDTCGLTQAVLGHLKGPALAPFVSQYVSVYIHADDPEGTSWEKKHGWPTGNMLPFVYVLRADGETLFKHSGIMQSAELRELLVTQAAMAGRLLSPKEDAILKKALEEAKQGRKKDDPGQAVKSLLPLKKLGPLGGLNCYAKPAVEANQLVAQLTKEGKATLKEIDEKLSSGNATFDAALAYARAKRVFTPLTTLKIELATASRKYERVRDLADTLRQAEAVDRAEATAASPHGKGKAIEAFQRIVSAYADTEAANVAAKELKKLADAGVMPSTQETRKPDRRTWADATGRFSLKARCRGVKDGEAVLETDDGRVVRVPIEKLSEKDREFLKSKQQTE